MSKSVASETNKGCKSLQTSRKRGGKDEEKENGEGSIEGTAAENLTTLTTVSAAPAVVDAFAFMHTPEFRRQFVDFVPVDALMALRVATKAWKAVADAFIDEGVASGVMLVHDGNDRSYRAAKPLMERRKLATLVVFLLNVMKVRERACWKAVNLVVVDIPEGVESIGDVAFGICYSLTTVSFPTTLTSIGVESLAGCSSLDNVDLLHTNLQELGWRAFCECSELRSMTLPDSIQTIDECVFEDCSKLFPSTMSTNYGVHYNIENDTSSEIFAYLRS